MNNKTQQQWERHNAPNGEHIWQGDTHIADITGESEEVIAEVAKFAVVSHNACVKINPNNPLAVAEAIGDMYEALETAQWVLGGGKIYKGKTGQYGKEITKGMALEIIDKALAKIKGGN